MSAKKGYYSLIQFCPDASRLETVNLGILLFCPEDGFIDARTTPSNQRAAKLVGRGALNGASLDAAKLAIEKRLRTDRETFATLEDLEQFINSRANILRLTQPRPVKVFDPANDLDNLFTELVDAHANTSFAAVAPKVQNHFPKLDIVFQKLEQQGRALLDIGIAVPFLESTITVPYAYRNGVWNFVKPQHFSRNKKAALKVAQQLALEGDLLYRHSAELEFDAGDNSQKQLVVVSKIEDGNSKADIQNRIDELLSEYHVKTVNEEEIDQFVEQVEQQAHS